MLFSALILLLPSVASALPHSPRDITLMGFDDDSVHNLDARSVRLNSRETGVLLRSATLLGFDGDTNTIHAFKRDTYLGAYPADIASRHLNERQDVGACEPLTTDQVQSVAGWSKFDDVWKGLFGDSEHVVHTNPQTEPDDRSNPPKQWNLPDLKAQRCIASDPIGTLTLQGDPTCTKQTSQITGTASGVNTSTTLTQSIGSSVQISHSVSNQESVGISTSFEATFGIPLVGDTKITTGFSFDYSHDDTKATTNTQSTTTTQAITVPNPDGKTCTASLDTETCTAKASGQIKTYGSGYVWYSYKDRKQFNEDFAKSKGINFPDNNKHWSWTIPLESSLSQDERIIYTPFTSDIGTSTVNSMYNATCT